MNKQIDPEKLKQMAELEQSIKAHQAMHENAMQQLNNLRETIASLKNFEELKGNEEIMLPLTTGILAVAKLQGKKLHMNVGYGVVKEKTLDECLTTLQEQEQEIVNFLTTIESEFQKLTMNVEEFKNV